MMQSLYLWVDLLVISVPLLGSFEGRISYYRRWPALFPAILGVMVPFILWDIAFTNAGVWHFSDRYSGFASLLGLPLAEWLFFICIPYSCLYIYEWVSWYRNGRENRSPGTGALDRFHLLMGIAFLAAALVFRERAYTTVVTGLSGILFLLLSRYRPSYIVTFWISYLFATIPFFLVNGFLTAKPIVLYDHSENLGIRLYTIPVEDLLYMFVLLLPIAVIYEYLKKRFRHYD